ncbi:MAG: radical SAM protein [Campylobacterota bacterium]
MSNIIFGPVRSRRFGTSLGIDLSPGFKQCNYDCLYCELKGAAQMATQQEVIAFEEVQKQIVQALQRYTEIDVITITANGEPTLYPHLKQLVAFLNTLTPKSLILTNSAALSEHKTLQTLLEIDIVKLSLDCADAACHKKLDRPVRGFDFDAMIEAMVAFSKQYRGDLIIEILLVRHINDSRQHLRALNAILRRLENIKRIDIGTVDRPPAYDVKALSYQQLLQAARTFDSDLPVAVVTRGKAGGFKASYSDKQILSTLSKRPLTKEDIEALFDAPSLRRFEQLLLKGLIYPKDAGGVEFFTSSQ